jgi:hypothetical protein
MQERFLSISNFISATDKDLYNDYICQTNRIDGQLDPYLNFEATFFSTITISNTNFKMKN